MSKINCEIINDVLPLYADAVVSDATKAMVEEHLAECADCSEKYREMKREIEVDAIMKAREAEKQALQAAKRKLRVKHIVAVTASAIAGVLLITAIIAAMILIKIPAEYEEGRFRVSEREMGGTNCLFLDYTGKMYGYEAVEAWDGEKLIHYVLIYTTPWHELFGGEDDYTRNELLLTTLGKSKETQVDEVRYITTGDSSQFYEPTRDYEKLAEDSVLIWERE